MFPLLFDRLRQGLMDPEWVSLVRPELEERHRAHMDRIRASLPEEAFCSVFGVDLQVKPGVYIPSPYGSSVFFLRGITNEKRPLGNILELGCGSGVVGLVLKKLGLVGDLTLSDVNPDAVQCARMNAEINEIPAETLISDVFSAFDGKVYDSIVFNLPFYHRNQVEEGELALSDLHGQLAQQFLNEAMNHLAPGGEIWFTYSNISSPGILEQAAKKWDLHLRLSEWQPDSGVMKMVYRGSPKMDESKLQFTVHPTESDMLSFVLQHGLPMCRDGKYRYFGMTTPDWYSTKELAICAAINDPGADLPRF
jgi:methylase of polypeptide subunit release factors